MTLIAQAVNAVVNSWDLLKLKYSKGHHPLSKELVYVMGTKKISTNCTSVMGILTCKLDYIWN